MRKKILYVFFIVMVLTASVCKILSIMDVSPKDKDAIKRDKSNIIIEKRNATQDENEKLKINKTVYLTFDDGPSKNTYKVLDILKQNNIKATFFVIGTNITGEYEGILREMEGRGHIIGIHTFSHKYNYIYTNANNYIEDFNMAYNQLTGILNNTPSIYRFPGGSCNCYIGSNKSLIVDELKARGFTYYDWQVSGEDSVGKPTKEEIVNNVLKDVDDFDNPIVLLHDSSINGNTVEALPEIIRGLKERGYEFGVLK